MNKLFLLPIIAILVGCSSTSLTVYHKQKDGFYIASDAKKIGLTSRVATYDNSSSMLINSMDSLLRKKSKIVTKIVTNTVNQSNATTFPLKMASNEIKMIANTGENLIISIELLNIVETNTTDKSGLVNAKYTTSRVLKGNIGWRVYDANSGDLLRENIFTTQNKSEYKADTEQEAQNFMNIHADSIRKVFFREVASDFGDRLFIKSSTRYIHTKGNLSLEEAKHYLKVNDYETAKQIWEEGITNTIDTKELKKLHHNLAVYYEYKYMYDEAIKHADIAGENSYKSQLEKYKTLYNS